MSFLNWRKGRHCHRHVALLMVLLSMSRFTFALTCIDCQHAAAGYFRLSEVGAVNPGFWYVITQEGRKIEVDPGSKALMLQALTLRLPVYIQYYCHGEHNVSLENPQSQFSKGASEKRR